MKLRHWQTECINLAIQKYENGQKNFLTLASPGAGKTVMACGLANELLIQNLIDIIVCFSPSSVVCADFCSILEMVIGHRFDGLLGSKGQSLTYQSMQYLDDSFWQLFSDQRVFVIFDEIHHCAGSNTNDANVWGEQIILNIQGKAEFSIALTGTPWRSDTAPIVLSRYASRTSKIECDYVYGISRAVFDGVCRTPQIIAVDNDHISVTEKDGEKSFSSFNDLFSNSLFPYNKVIQNEKLLLHILKRANNKLDEVRTVNPAAGGLIVASSIEHVHKIALLMKTQLGEDSTTITYKEDDPTQLIRQYRNSSSKWVVSVGMISEGTNIPRLQVTCHLTKIKTEMHFRQILGRNMRMTDQQNQESIMFMPAEPKLVEYAYRIADDIPDEADIVILEKMTPSLCISGESENTSYQEPPIIADQGIELNNIEFECDATLPTVQTKNNSELTDNYEKTLNIFGKFKQETLELGLSPID
ncbi:DEAD/DEAH box helicase [Parashewanella spongiae]|uniref:DEAD/DEAH box helicase n=1 Tax=Parashewanella spongiae TaxID=342950 RepID=A0A3A6TLI2_9GAMM|nr:DEAD/DEAH box helicase family protein [Parashewanella spongiae]MCL1078615.1 DEAD/DEAH box helicase [Parashewanella spongiae]RJY13018.1 DEAD/DEAH box helicase [Parashewanella spongiae]